MKEQASQMMDSIRLFMAIIAIVLLALTFYQLILSVEGNLRDNQWQIGVLRAMGMRQSDIQQVTFLEASSNIIGAGLLGFAAGYIASLISVL